MSTSSNITCNGCNALEFSNVRYKCQCYNNKTQTLNHLISHTVLRIELPSSTMNKDLLAKQHVDQMNHLEETYLSKRLVLEMMSNLSTTKMETKSISSSNERTHRLSVDELYEYLIQYDLNLKSLAEKFRKERVSGNDLINLDENDYKSFDITYGEKKKLQVLIEQKQSNVLSQELTQMQNEITQLKSLVKKQEEEMGEKMKSIQQLEDIVEKQEQQTQIQNEIIKQLQEAVEQQNQEKEILMELVKQQRQYYCDLFERLITASLCIVKKQSILSANRQYPFWKEWDQFEFDKRWLDLY
ncbi:hypothetical protein I4U23_022901 [Adineta vaga]|nr:hypothetical protein I4U23_022901 [Adineta vaga]